MRLHLANAVTRAVKETFQVMLSTDLAVGEPFLRSEAVMFDGVSAIIGMAGRLAGSISIHCSEPVALVLTSKLLCSEVKELGPEVHDAIGELANVVAGTTKRIMSETVSLFEISIPTIVSGRQHRVSPWVKWPSTHLRFDANGEGLNLEAVISLAQQEE